ncbi:MAG: site-2 protease family protein [Candidatus Micrarchaeota archaeon]
MKTKPKDVARKLDKATRATRDSQSLTPQSRVAVSLVTIACALVFFAAALSTEDNLIKAPVMIASLVFSGWFIQRYTHAWGKYGLVMIKGQGGLALMKTLGDRHPKLMREAADFGLTMGFGIPYAFALFFLGGEKKKFAIHAVAAAAFYGWFASQAAGVNALLLPVGLAAGFLGIGLLTLASSTVMIFASKTASSAVAPLVPGITVPWEAIAAAIIIATVHEVAHGVLARVEKIRIKASGAVLWGFIPVAAFVEPDEEQLSRASIWKKRRVLAAGTASNFYFFIIFMAAAFAFVQLALPPLVQGAAINLPENSTLQGILPQGAIVQALNGQPLTQANDANAAYRTGKEVTLIVEGKEYRVPAVEFVVTETEATQTALVKGDVITHASATRLYNLEQLRDALTVVGSDSLINLTLSRQGKNVEVAARTNADGKLGVQLSQKAAFLLQDKPKPGLQLPFALATLLASILALTAVLNLALAIINVLPVFITDGHRIIYEELAEKLGKNTAAKAAAAAGAVTLGLIVINLARWFKII